MTELSIILFALVVLMAVLIKCAVKPLPSGMGISGA